MMPDLHEAGEQSAPVLHTPLDDPELPLPEAGPLEQLQPGLVAGDGQAGVPGPLQV